MLDKIETSEFSISYSSDSDDDEDDDDLFSKDESEVPAWVRRGQRANYRRRQEARTRILVAIAELHNSGQKITQRAVRARAGGSFRTITAVMRTWKRFRILPWLPVEVISNGIRQGFRR